MALHEIQGRFGYVPRDVSKQLSELMDVPLARIYEVLTFYNYFKLDPPGKHTVCVCAGTACYLNGATAVADQFKEQLNLKEGETTPDGEFHLQMVRCVGCCGLAPVVVVDAQTLSKVKPESVKDIIARAKQEG